MAVRSLQEKAKLSRRLAETVGHGELADRYSAMADEAESAVAVLGDHLWEAYSEVAEPGEASAG